MTNDQYLRGILATQDLSTQEMDVLRQLREKIEGQLSQGLNGNPRFYYAGSYGKRTMIRARYDLDIVLYWPVGYNNSIKEIYDAVGRVLERNNWITKSKTVSWELPFDGGFHIDIVPGRALDAQYRVANLHRTDTKTTLQTSLKAHIDTVRNSGRRDAIRLMKLWREKKRVPFKKSFLLEMMTIDGCSGRRVDDIENQLGGALIHVRDNIRTCNVKDPANSNNSLSDDLSGAERQAISTAAAAAVSAKTWHEVFN